MGIRIITQPSCEPVTLNEARLYLRMPDGFADDDETISQLITAARQHIEGRLRRQIVQATHEYTLDAFPVARLTADSPHYQRAGGIRLPNPPLIGVTKIEYVDGAGTTKTLSSAAYVADATCEPGVVMPAFNSVWPVCRDQPSSVIVTYTAGYGTSLDTTIAQKQAAVPAAIKLAIKMLVLHWYDPGKAPVNIGNIVNEVEHTLSAILAMQGYGSYVE